MSLAKLLYYSNPKETTIQKPSTETRKALVLPDVHAPFHNKQLMDLILSMIKKNRNEIDEIIISGDFLDMYAISSYNEGSLGKLKNISIEEEYNLSYALLLNIINSAKKNCKITYMYGNHEDRFRTFLSKKCNEKFRGVLQSPADGLKLVDLGINIIEAYPDGIYSFGDIDIIHGELYNKFVTKSHLDGRLRSVIFGHTHRIQMYMENSVCAYNIGWLGDKDSYVFNYKNQHYKNTNWSNGFAIIHLDQNEHAHTQLIQCKNNSFFAFGEFYGQEN